MVAAAGLGAVEVTVPQARARRCPPEVVLRRRNLDPVDLVVVRGLPVTALPLTVLDAAAALGNDSGRPLVNRSLQRRVSFASVARRVLPILRPARDAVAGAGAAAGSGLGVLAR